MLMRPSMLLALLAAAGSCSICAQAQPAEGDPPPIWVPPPPPPPPPPSVEHLQLAQRLAGLIVMSEIREEVLRTPPKPAPDDDGDPTTNPPIRAQRSAEWNVASAAATTYARLYSIEELKAMIAFFDSPAGQKYLAARRQGVVNVVSVFERLPWYPDLYYRTCGGQEFCRWKPEQEGAAAGQ
jgi:hypothetical protein